MNNLKPKMDEIIEWDVVNWSRALPFWLENTKLNLKKTTSLDIGGRDGGLCLWLSNQCNKVIYSDINTPPEHCLELHKKYNAQNVTYKKINATQPIKERGVNLITSKSVLNVVGVEDRMKIIQSIYDALPKGGEYWFVDNLQASIVHQKLRKRFVPWGDRWDYLHANELEEKFSSFSELHFKTFGLLGTFGRNNFQRNLLGTIDKLFLDKLVGKGMHYIVAGVARK